MTVLRPRLRSMFHLALVVLALSPATPGRAQESTVQLDPSQTQVGFTLGDVLHTVHGMFKLKRGNIKFDPATGHASGLVVVDATSGDSGGHTRDRKMHKEILESAHYPEITFSLQHVQGQVAAQGDSQIQVLGVFNLHGTDHPLTLTVQVHVAGNQVTADMHFTIPYVSWGLKNPSTFILRVNDTVDINIHAEGRIQAPATH